MTLSNNALIAAHISRQRWPSVKMTVWLAGGLWAMCLAFIGSLWLAGQYSFIARELIDVLIFSAILLAFITLAGIAFVTALLIAREVKSGHGHSRDSTPHQSGMSAADIARGYLTVALYKMRIPIAINVILTPVLTIGLVESLFYNASNKITLWLLGIPLTGLIIAGLIALALVNGINWGLRSQRDATGGGATGVVALLSMFIGITAWLVLFLEIHSSDTGYQLSLLLMPWPAAWVLWRVGRYMARACDAIDKRLTNPIITFHLRRQRRVSLHMVLAFAVELWLASLALMGWSWLTGGGTWVVGILVVVAIAATIVTPVASAYIAAIVTAREIESQRHTMLCLTDLTNADITWGHILVALHRSGIQIAFGIGLMPVLATVISSDFFYDNLSTGQLVQWLLHVTLATAIMGVYTLVGITGGVNLALHMRRVNTVAGAAPAIMFFSMIAWPLATAIVYFDLWDLENTLFYATFFMLLLPYLAAWGLLRMAQRTTRRTITPL